MTNKFCENLKTLRNELNLKQEEFAEKLNLSRGTISNWETGYSEPSLDTLIKISKTFDVSYEDLLL